VRHLLSETFADPQGNQSAGRIRDWIHSGVIRKQNPDQVCSRLSGERRRLKIGTRALIVALRASGKRNQAHLLQAMYIRARWVMMSQRGGWSAGRAMSSGQWGGGVNELWLLLSQCRLNVIRVRGRSWAVVRTHTPTHTHAHTLTV